MTENSSFFNWNVVLGPSSIKKNSPFPYGFIKNPLFEDIYEKLAEAYPAVDEKWYVPEDMSRAAEKRLFGDDEPKNAIDHDDSSLDPIWNKFRHYLFSSEFFEKMTELTGIKLTKLRHFVFIFNKKGSFNMPHAHHKDVSPDDYAYKVTVLMYFARDWKKGDSGGTYICENEDESSVIFEPDDLDNSMVWFAETPVSWHGSRYITKDVVRPSIQFTLS